MKSKCKTCGVEFQSEDFVSGRKYYSCSRCRNSNRNRIIHKYEPFEFLSSLKAKMRDSKLVNQIWSKIHHNVLEVSKGEVFELSCYNQNDFEKMTSLQDSYKGLSSYTDKVSIGEEIYYWTVYYR